MQRLFVAIDMPERIRMELARLKLDIQGVRWVIPEQLHLTLRFIGDAGEEQKNRLIKELLAIQFIKFRLVLTGIGFFQTHGIPRILWTGVLNSPPLVNLRERVENACISAGLLPDDRHFSPHLTIARIKNGTKDDIRRYVATHNGFRSSRFEVDGFSLYSSTLEKDGALHRVIVKVDAD